MKRRAPFLVLSPVVAAECGFPAGKLASRDARFLTEIESLYPQLVETRRHLP